ncbi:MAG: PH domain-containing protein [Bacillales bacterium]|jgi:uncharacterized membrane protein YdbT with pleckstrin-like domain|nr:PH domain-containing protein [Bacillales bacterium]
MINADKTIKNDRLVFTTSFIASFLAFLFVSFCFVLSLFAEENEIYLKEFFNNYGVYTIVGLIVLSLFVGFLTGYVTAEAKTFTISDNYIKSDYKFISKKSVTVDYDKINNLKVTRSLLSRFFGLGALHIQSGSATFAAKSEIVTYQKKAYCEYLKGYLQNRIDKKESEELVLPKDKVEVIVEESEDVIRVSKKQLLQKSLLESFILIILLVASLLVSLILWGKYTLTTDSGEDFEAMIIPLSFAGTLFLSIISLFLYNLLHYASFKASIFSDKIKIEYGFFQKDEVIINRDKIHGYTIRQGLFAQLFKVGKLTLNVIGTVVVSNNEGGSSSSETSILSPFAPIIELKKIIERVFPEYQKKIKTSTPDKNAFLHNFIIPFAWGTLFLLAFLLPLTTIHWTFIFIYLFVLVISLADALLKKQNELAISNKYYKVVSAGLYKKTICMKTSSVQEVNSFAGFIRRKQGLATYVIQYRSSTSLGIATVYITNIPLIDVKFEDD